MAFRQTMRARLALGSICAPAVWARCEHPDAKFFREQAEHQSLNLSPLQEAKLAQWFEVARKCRDGDPNEADERGVSVLHVVAKAGKSQLVDILLKLGARPGEADRVQGRTALHHAAATGHTATMTTLLDAGAQPDAADLAGATPLHLAAQAGERFAARLLLRWCEPNTADIYGVAPLHKAVAFGHAATVQVLLADSRVRVDQPVGEVRAPEGHAALSGGETALILAASHTYHFNHTKHTRIAALLLEAGADPNTPAPGGQTAAHRAARSGNAGVVAALLRCRRTQWDARDDQGRTPRQLAAAGKHAEVLKLLDGAGVVK